jgi:hypothetical protein
MPDFLTRVLALFQSLPDISKMGFLTAFFRVTPESFTDSDKAEIDVVRSGEEIAPVLRNPATGAVTVVEDEFTNKTIPFPWFSLETPVNIIQLMTREPGETAYLTERVNWLGRLASKLVSAFGKHTRMIRRSIELQAAQVLQTGTINLTDEDGKTAWTLDLKPKATHFTTAAVDWGADGSDPEGDIAALADVIRDDGQADVRNLIFDDAALRAFLADEKVQRDLKVDGYRLGALDPRIADKGAKYYGYIHIGSDLFDLWVYRAKYNPFGSTEYKSFLEPNTVLFLPALEDLDFRRLFGGIPQVRPDRIFDEIFGADKITIDGEYDFKPRVRWDDKGETYYGAVKSRPLCFPASIDRFGRLTTKTTV